MEVVVAQLKLVVPLGCFGGGASCHICQAGMFEMASRNKGASLAGQSVPALHAVEWCVRGMRQRVSWCCAMLHIFNVVQHTVSVLDQSAICVLCLVFPACI